MYYTVNVKGQGSQFYSFAILEGANALWVRSSNQLLQDVSGHATTFCRFLASELVPYVDRNFRTSATKGSRALIGHWVGKC